MFKDPSKRILLEESENLSKTIPAELNMQFLSCPLREDLYHLVFKFHEMHTWHFEPLGILTRIYIYIHERPWADGKMETGRAEPGTIGTMRQAWAAADLDGDRFVSPEEFDAGLQVATKWRGRCGAKHESYEADSGGECARGMCGL